MPYQTGPASNRAAAVVSALNTVTWRREKNVSMTQRKGHIFDFHSIHSNITYRLSSILRKQHSYKSVTLTRKASLNKLWHYDEAIDCIRLGFDYITSDLY